MIEARRHAADRLAQASQLIAAPRIQIHIKMPIGNVIGRLFQLRDVTRDAERERQPKENAE